MRTRMSGGVGGGSRKAIPYPDLGDPPPQTDYEMNSRKDSILART